MLSRGKKTDKTRRKSLYVEIMAISRLFSKAKNKLDRVVEHCQIKQERATKTDERRRLNEKIRARMKRIERGRLREALALSKQNLTAPNGVCQDELAEEPNVS